jgi:hypothetical protein
LNKLGRSKTDLGVFQFQAFSDNDLIQSKNVAAAETNKTSNAILNNKHRLLIYIISQVLI